MIARLLRWLDALAEGADPIFWPPSCDVWITCFDPTCHAAADPEAIPHGAPEQPTPAMRPWEAVS